MEHQVDCLFTLNVDEMVYAARPEGWFSYKSLVFMSEFREVTYCLWVLVVIHVPHFSSLFLSSHLLFLLLAISIQPLM